MILPAGRLRSTNRNADAAHHQFQRQFNDLFPSNISHISSLSEKTNFFFFNDGKYFIKFAVSKFNALVNLKFNLNLNLNFLFQFLQMYFKFSNRKIFNFFFLNVIDFKR